MTKKDKKEKERRSGPPPMKPGHQYLNPDKDDQMEIIGYYPNTLKIVIVWGLIVMTGGLLRLFYYWFPHLMIKSSHTRCDLQHASIVLLKDQYQQCFVSRVKTSQEEPLHNTWIKKRKVAAVTGVGYKTSSSSVVLESMTALTAVGCDSFNIDFSRYFITKKEKYIWNDETNVFQKMKGLEDNTDCSFFHKLEGLSKDQQQERRIRFGENSIRVHVSPVIEIILKQVMSPFYIFQMFSCALWLQEQYYYYTISLLVINFFSIASYIYQTRKMQRALRNTIAMSTIVSVCRGGQVYEDISSEDLVPGDVIEIPRRGCMMQCDAVLVSGNCIVNESMLTGESVPMTKTPLPRHDNEELFSIKEHARHVLFCGTKVIQTQQQGQDKVKAIVVRTGFSTTKGGLVRSILYPKPVEFKFQRDSYIFIGLLSLMGVVGFTYTIIIMIQRGFSASEIILRSLDVVTTAVPAALPLALTIGVVFAQSRLQKCNIYCISPNSINVSGTINVFCFDKTGTLTEDGLKLQGIVPVSANRYLPETETLQEWMGSSLFNAMATCHSLTVIEGETTGDPLDLIIFEATACSLAESRAAHSQFALPVSTVVKLPTTQKSDTNMLGIVRQFTFTSNLQRMSVIVSESGKGKDKLMVYCKGAPEMIISLSKPESVPPDFHDILESYTKHGFRVLALGGKDLEGEVREDQVQKVPRLDMEKDLNFLGLLVMENRLMEETTPVIHQLRDADIKTVMVTGDNILTALSVAEECGMVNETDNVILVQGRELASDSAPAYLEYTYANNDRVDAIPNSKDRNLRFALDGKTWAIIRQHFPDVLPKIVLKGVVFARMSPEQKAQLIESLQDLGYYVGMCGDGANDCGALKTAHAGISLSEAEASVASPFTSKKANIECVPTLIREGRAALVTSFGLFKFMACYSLTEFTSVCILYWVSQNMSDFEYLYVDMFLLATLAVTFGRTSGYDYLVKKPPIINLFSVGPVLSLLALVGVQICFQVFCFLHVSKQDWYVPLVSRWEYDYTSYQNTAVYIMSCYQYIILAITLSKGEPYRRSIFTNYWFLGNIVVCTAITLWLTIYPVPGAVTFLELKPSPSVPYRFMYVGLAIMDFLICIMLEDYVLSETFISYKLQEKLEEWLAGYRHTYSLLEEEMAGDDWPPISNQQPINPSVPNNVKMTSKNTTIQNSNVSIQDETFKFDKNNHLQGYVNTSMHKL
ncbi:probable cation-transporting ATPase 13A3 [Mizuhopecten yessoensis]|uniref:Cation-transporting ATPase n=1 Tax=Mizuhopecten yessoensis TaxID=6573 RepID=A0A210PX66_MIZYE|nr:probable cation-transporting ATPase 13A3 [Mizuhopecten yessoensis]OWF41075.1 cation-transporting ATPase 13A3 [Mizuhopecten yessoensis]